MRIKTLLARAAVPALTLGLLGGALLSTSSPAQAWPGDHNVTVTGRLAGCGASGPIQGGTYVRSNLNGEIRTWYAPAYSSQPTYALRFDNVPGGAGGWAWTVVHCGVLPDYGTWIKVQQPLIGENWNGGTI